MTRQVLPPRRPGISFELTHNGSSFWVTAGFYDGSLRQLGEVFVTSTKVGSDAEAIARDAAVLLSIALQHGVPLDAMQTSITRTPSGGPSSVIGAVIDRLHKEVSVL